MSTETLWIVVAAVVVVLLLIALVVGLVVARNRRISLREDDEPETGEKRPPTGGTYQAGSGFSFSSGTATAPEPPRARDATTTVPPDDADATAAPAPDARPDSDARPGDGERPDGGGRPDGGDGPGEGAGTTPDTRKPGVIDTAEASKDPATTRLDPRDAPPDTSGPATPGTATPGTATPGTAGPGPAGPDTTAPGRDPAATPRTTATPPADPATAPSPGSATAPDTTAPETGTPGRHAATGGDTTAPPETAPSSPKHAAPAETAPGAPATAPGAPAESAPGAPAEEIAPAEGRLGRLRGRLSRSRSGLGQSLLGLLGAGQMDEESWEDVEATLLQADLGPETTGEIVGRLREQLATRAVRTADGARAVLRDVLTEALDTGQDRSVRALPHDGRPAVLLVVGVNGTGKTTTTGKLARVLVAGGHRVTLGAADTFRAAAAEQLATWGRRAGAGVVRGPEGSDPASVAFDAVKRGTADGVDAVLLDTAGRLHTKTGLMDELGKVKRVVEKQARVDEVLLVLDATTGQNGLAQARVFGDVVDVTGIALTKLDGTAKGGIVFRVQRELGVPVKLVGLGEGPDDLAPFEPSAFVDALLT